MGCRQKRRYGSKRAAKLAVRRMQRHRRAGAGVLNAYFCAWCKWWHVGHRPW